MATHSSTLPWRIPWIIRKKSNITERLSLSFTFCPNLDFVNTSLSCHLALCCVLLVECRRDIAKYSRGRHVPSSFLLVLLAPVACHLWCVDDPLQWHHCPAGASHCFPVNRRLACQQYGEDSVAPTFP